MPWSQIISSDAVVAIHAALVPTVNPANKGDGEILFFGGDNHDIAESRAKQFNHTLRFNCRQPTSPLMRVSSPDFDLFCSGHAFLGDGRLLVAGGTEHFPPDAGGIHHNRHFTGHRHAVIYDPLTGNFLPASDMSPEHGHDGTGGGRWYPTLCTLANGEVIAFQGHPADNDTRHGNTTPEQYQALTNRWVILGPVGNATHNPILYPRIHLLRDGSLFVSSTTPGYTGNIQFDPFSGDVMQVSALPDGAYAGFDFPSVLLPLVPADNYQPRVLLCGGIRSQLIDLGQASPAWVNIPRNGSTANLVRTHACATLLPTGDVLMTGGTSGGNDQIGVFNPEIYRTPIDHQTNRYVSGVGHWDTIVDPAKVLRNYHSTALLMPDARVWTAGGNSPNQPNSPPTETQEQIEIYSPPYPAGIRPTINSAPSSVTYGITFEVTTTNANEITSVVMMRCGSSTHAFDPDQRMVALQFSVHNTSTLTVTAPPNGAVAPPGPYMLFIVDRQGRPCDYARFVHVRH